MKKNLLPSAFTLIEMLFIIVIIGIIAALSIVSFQQRAQNVKIDKAALQMQQILQAANQYYLSWNCWPGSNNCAGNVPNFNFYLPIGTSTNPWGNPYTYQQNPNQPNIFLLYSGNLPNDKTAELLVSLLPNASIYNYSNNARQVIITSAPNQNNFVTISYIKANTGANLVPNIFSFACPAGTNGEGIAIPIAIQADDQNCSPAIFPTPVIPITPSKMISQLNLIVNYPCPKITKNNIDYYTCTSLLTFSTHALIPTTGCGPTSQTSNAGAVSFLNMGVCQPH